MSTVLNKEEYACYGRGDVLSGRAGPPHNRPNTRCMRIRTASQLSNAGRTSK